MKNKKLWKFIDHIGKMEYKWVEFQPNYFLKSQPKYQNGFFTFWVEFKYKEKTIEIINILCWNNWEKKAEEHYPKILKLFKDEELKDVKN